MLRTTGHLYLALYVPLFIVYPALPPRAGLPVEGARGAQSPNLLLGNGGLGRLKLDEHGVDCCIDLLRGRRRVGLCV